MEEERKGSERGRGSMDKGETGKNGEMVGGGGGRGRGGGERDLRAHPALIKEPSP